MTGPKAKPQKVERSPNTCSGSATASRILRAHLLHSLSICQIREDIKRGCYVEGLSEEIVQNGEGLHARHMLQRGGKSTLDSTGATTGQRWQPREHFNCCKPALSQVRVVINCEQGHLTAPPDPLTPVEDAMRVLRRGAESRHVGETRLNRESSRSHSVFTCVIERHSRERVDDGAAPDAAGAGAGNEGAATGARSSGGSGGKGQAASGGKVR
jgi:hypothetical protein